MVAAVPSLMLTYGSDTTLFGFSSTSQQFFMLGSGANANLEALGGSETDAQTIWPSGSITLLWCRVKTAATGTMALMVIIRSL